MRCSELIFLRAETYPFKWLNILSSSIFEENISKIRCTFLCVNKYAWQFIELESYFFKVFKEIFGDLEYNVTLLVQNFPIYKV